MALPYSPLQDANNAECRSPCCPAAAGGRSRTGAAHPDATPAAAGQPTLAAQRYPQSVQVGSLLRRQVLRPVEGQNVLGRVASVVRRRDGTVLIVVDARGAGISGVLGLGRRMVAVPVATVSLLGEHVALTGLSPEQLHALPDFASAGTQPVPANEMIQVGLTRPSH